MASKKIDPNKVLTIIVGGDSDKDDEKLFTNPEEWKTHPRHAFYVDSYEEMLDLLSPAKLDLLSTLFSYGSIHSDNTVGAIAQKLNRKQEAVSRDLHQLKKQKLVQLTKNGRKVNVSTPFESIEIRFERKK
jgi:predicted transcriptional regulator